MKSRKFLGSLVALSLALTGSQAVLAGGPVSTAFTYQGQLMKDGAAFQGATIMSFSLWDANNGGVQIGSTIVCDGGAGHQPAVSVNDGLFTVPLDFGSGQFDGTARWLQVVVNGTALTPRQSLTTTPYAQFAMNAGSAQSADYANAAPGSNFWGQTGADLYNATGGSVGIGTVTPTCRLDIVGNSPTRQLRVMSYDYNFTPFGAFFSLDASPTGGKEWTLFSSSDAAGEGAGRLVFKNNTDGNEPLALTADGKVGVGTTNPANSLSVVGSADFSGAVGIGTSTPATKLHVSGGLEYIATFESYNATATRIDINNTSTSGRSYELISTGQTNGNGAGKFMIRDVTANLIRFALDSTGKIGIGRQPTANILEVEGNASKTAAGSWLANSDARIKTNVETVSNALDTLDRVRLVSFDYTAEYLAAHPGLENRRYLNVIAQEFAQVFPDHVKSSGETLPNGDAILQVDTYPLTIYSAAAIQELNRKLEQENAELTTKQAELEKRLAKLEAALRTSK